MQIQNSKQTIWSLKDTIKVLLGFFGINAILFALWNLHVKYGVFNFFITTNQILNGVLLYILSVVTFLIPLYFFAIRRKKAKLSDFGIVKITLWQGVRTVLLGYGILILLTSIIALITLYFGDIPGIGPQRSVLPIFGEGTFAVTIAAIIAIGIAPTVEEIFFRGFLLNSFMSEFSFFTATIITSAIFAFVHFQFESILGIFILSLIINYLYKVSGKSTSATIIFHMVNNTVAIAVLLNLDKITK